MKEHIIINKDRTVVVPDSVRKIGIQYDHKVNTLTFDCPRYADDNQSIDLSRMAIYVNFSRNDKTKGSIAATNVFVDPDDSEIMHFDFVITRSVTLVNGPIICLVCAKSTDAEGVEDNHWNSELFNKLSVGEGMEAEEELTEEEIDYITSLLQEINTTHAEVADVDTRVEDLEFNQEKQGAVSEVDLEAMTWTEGSYITGSGTIGSSSGYGISELVTLPKMSTLILDATGYQSDVAMIAKSDHTPLVTSVDGKTHYEYYTDEEIQVYISCKTTVAKSAKIVRNVAETLSDLERENSELKGDIKNIHQSSSLVDFENINWIKNVYIDNNTGEEVSYANWVATDYIELSPQKLACVHLNDDGVFSIFDALVYYAWYDSNKKYLIGSNKTSVLDYFDENAEYIRLSFREEQTVHVVLNTEAVIDALMGKDVSYFVPYGKIKIFNEETTSKLQSSVSGLQDDVAKLQSSTYILPDSWIEKGKELRLKKKNNFVFGIQTDTHFSCVTDGITFGNNIKELTKSVGVDFIANLGDIIRGCATENVDDIEHTRESYTELMKRYVDGVCCPFLFTMGNHDMGNMWANAKEDTSLVIPRSEVYARTISMCKNTFPTFLSDGKSLYYAIDFPDAKIRVIALNTTDGSTDSSQSEFYISDKQKEWIKNKALNTKYSVIVLGHTPLEGTQNVMVYNAVTGGSDVMGYLREFKNNGGTLIGCFWGHNHAQVSEVVDGILHVSFGYRDTAEFLIIDQKAKTITTVGFGVENRNFQF